ncbi:MAG: YkgJ family cysteine cluster protein [Deltaproteobacteria bacterium]|nr:YkgJ family cysteine cluster protein [Deltaproteobacteria bacterium]
MTPIPGSDHRTECIGCGECCRRSSPSLQVSDIPGIIKGPVKRSDLYTLRRGELVRDNIGGGLKKTENEIIKIREREGIGGCIFYDDPGKRCTIYEYRPTQCAAMKCWDETEFMRVYGEPKADRRDVVQDGNLLRLIKAHEERCEYPRLERDVRDIETMGETAVEKILAILKFDHDIRSLTHTNLGIDPDELDLIFGRPLTQTIAMFGLKVVREPDGSFLLTLSDPLPRP